MNSAGGIGDIAGARDDALHQLKVNLLQAAEGLRRCRDVISALPAIETSLIQFHDGTFDRLAALSVSATSEVDAGPSPSPLPGHPKKDDAQRLLNLKSIAKEIGISRATLDRYRKVHPFPEPYRFSGRTMLFDRTEVDNWLAGMRSSKGEKQQGPADSFLVG